MRKGYDMKRKHLIILIAIVAALALTLSVCIYWYLNINSMSKLLPDKRELTEDETVIAKKVGYPDWKTYIITYFLMLFTLIALISGWFAAVFPGRTGSSVSMITQLVSLGLEAIIFKDMLAEKSKFLYDKKLFIISAACMVFSLILTAVYAFIKYTKKKGKQKDLDKIAEERKNTKIIVLDKCTLTVGDIDFAALDALGNTEYYDILTKEEIISVSADADVILCNKAVIDKEIMDSCPKLKYIGLFATGYNNIDVKYAAEKGITVCNAPNYSTDSVAQLTFAYILNHTTSLDKYNESTHNGEWIKARAFSYFPYPINELKSKKICIIGYGAIGKQVAKIADAFGMKIFISTRTKPENCPYPLVSVDEAFEIADYLTVHCPLTDKTRGLISKERLATMKKTAFVINTARGAVADEKALREALDGHIIAGAACDVLTVEPMREDDVLIGAENLTLTPHIAWASYEARVRLISLVASNLRAYQNGLPVNVVK